MKDIISFLFLSALASYGQGNDLDKGQVNYIPSAGKPGKPAMVPGCAFWDVYPLGSIQCAW